MSLNIQHAESGNKGLFFIGTEAAPDAALTYTKAGDELLILDHTEVGDSLRGQGAGVAMVETAVAFARAHAKKIMPLCPFARSVFQKREDLRDVLRGG